MEKQTGVEIKVGIFVLLGVVVFALSVLLLGGDQMFLTSTFDLKARFPQVQGLSKGSVVSLAGFPVGNVAKIEFEPGTSKLVLHLDIDREFQNRFTAGTLATVKTQGALGDKYVYIEPGPLDASPLNEGAFVDVSVEGDFLDVITEKTKDLSNIVDVVNEAHTLLKALNHEGRSALLMKEMLQTTTEMQTFLLEAKRLVQDIRGGKEDEAKLKASMIHLASILEKVDKGEGTLGALINDPALHERIVSLLGEKPRNKFLKPLIRDSIKKSEGTQP
jgi:phospholipid/cholesterol/gamma-HCH transport system substrate-binding protein